MGHNYSISSEQQDRFVQQQQQPENLRRRFVTFIDLPDSWVFSTLQQH
jgi:hypothetical protein